MYDLGTFITPVTITAICYLMFNLYIVEVEACLDNTFIFKCASNCCYKLKY